MKMSLIILATVLAGVFSGYFILPSGFSGTVDALAPYVLYALMIFVGFDLGHNKHIFRSLKTLGIQIIFLPLGIVIGSLIGGYLSALIFGMAQNEGLAISAGLGWYSLSGVLLKQMGGAELGAIAFLTNVMRELLTFMVIPLLAGKVPDAVIIAPAGATSMDTTLPLITKYTQPKMAVVSLLNGMILSLLVAPLVTFFYYI